MIVYGKNVWKSCKENPSDIKKIYVSDQFRDRTILSEIQSLHIPVQTVSKQELNTLARDIHHQGIVLDIQSIRKFPLDQLIGGKDFIVALDGIQDPHNVGAILRTCECAGVDGLILPKHRSASLTSAAVKTSAGAAFHVPVSVVANLSQALKTLKEQGYWIIGTDMENARDYREGIYDTKICVVIGSEGKGISPLVKKQCDYTVSIPMMGTTGSLNASVACGILLYQIFQKKHPL